MEQNFFIPCLSSSLLLNKRNRRFLLLETRELRNKMLSSSSSLFRNPLFKHLLLFRPLIVHSSSSSTSLFSAFSPLKYRTRENRIFAGTLSSVSLSSMPSPSSDNNWTDVSSNSPYFSVRIHCRKDVADMLSEALLCFGATSASMDEPDNFQGTDEICITSIFTECHDADTCISHAADSIGLKEIPAYEVIRDEQCDWVKKTQESFHPVEVTDGLWIVPEWRTPPNSQATNIILNPGLAFGTGEHPTTKLCLLLLHKVIKGGEFVLDYGTGSGILAIAALKFGAALSVGIDIDPEAITRAHQNAALNKIGPEQLQLCLVNNKTDSPLTEDQTCGNAKKNRLNSKIAVGETEAYDIIIANILLNPLLELADQIAAYAKPGALVAVSGILSEQLPQIEECYSHYLEEVSVSRLDGWACVSGKKKGRSK